MIVAICKQSLRQGNVFTRVCHSVHRGKGFCLMGSASRWSVSSRVCLQEGVCLLEILHPGDQTEPQPPGIRKADGTHPTGVLSYPNIYFSMCAPKLVLVQIVDTDYYVIVVPYWLGNELFCKNQGYDYQQVAG